MNSPIKVTETQSVLQSSLGKSASELTARDGIAAMCDFYTDMRVDGAAIENDRDMLLCQWGVDTFNAPDTFQLNVTRQLNIAGESQPYQLALIFNYPAVDTLKQIDFGNQWCRSPGDLPAFRQFVESSAAFKAVADVKPARVDLKLQRRG